MNIEEVVNKAVNGEIELHEIDNLLDANAAMVARRMALEKILNISLPAIGSTILDYSEIKNKNTENMIGAIQIPVGVVGPLKVEGDYARGLFYVPIATTEGALIASVNRGAKAVTKSGGAKVKIFFDGMTRAPLFVLPDIASVEEFLSWVKEHKEDLRKIAKTTTSHGDLIDVQPFTLGNNVWLRFVFSSGDAMGMNMATIASEAICDYIEENFEKAKCIAVSGNLCSDKKQSMVNSLFGRGKTVIAEAVIKEEVLKEVLHTTAERINEVNVRKNLLGGARAGNIYQFNAHFANIITGIFIATGQDVAQVVESSTGFTWTEVRDKNLYISVTLPSLEVGTVGGGTRLPTQREALSIMGVAGSGNPIGSNAKKFAEIIAATVLAGELNLLAALSNRELGRAHKALGRGIKA